MKREEGLLIDTHAQTHTLTKTSLPRCAGRMPLVYVFFALWCVLRNASNLSMYLTSPFLCCRRILLSGYRLPFSLAPRLSSGFAVFISKDSCHCHVPDAEGKDLFFR